MRRWGIVAALATGSLLSSVPADLLERECAVLGSESMAGARYRNKRRIAYDRGAGRYRSKNAPTRRKLRSNRLHISRRVRRQHRRAA